MTNEEKITTIEFTISNEDMCQKCPLFGGKKATKQIEKPETQSVTSVTPVCDEHAILDLYESLFCTVRDYQPWGKKE